MASQLGHLNHLESQTLTTNVLQSRHVTSSEVLPSRELPSPTSASLSPELGYIYDFTGVEPASAFLLTKENIPLSTNQFSPPSYDSFFSTRREPFKSLPTSYGDLWNTTLFQSSPNTTLSPIGSIDALHSFGSPEVPSSSDLFWDSDTACSPSSSPQFLMSPSTKRKLLHESLSQGLGNVTEFDNPDPKRTKLDDSELPVSEKLHKIFDFFETLGWRTDTFLHHFFVKDKDNPRSHRHRRFFERVLNGKDDHCIAEILGAWWATVDQGDSTGMMYSVTVPFLEIRTMGPALSSFAAQIIEEHLLKEARTAVQETSGLHATMTSKTEHGVIKWADLGASLMATTKTSLQTHQPLTFHYMSMIAEPHHRKRKGELVIRNYRPPELVGLFSGDLFRALTRLLGRDPRTFFS